MTELFTRGLRLPAAGLFRAALPALLAGLFCLVNFWLPFASGAAAADFKRASFGSLLLAGLRDGSVGQNMPLFGTLFSAALNLGAGPAPFLAAVYLACCLLIFCAGCLLRGYRAGVAALAVAGALEAAGALPYDDEQSFYALALLLVLALLLIKSRENTLKNSLLCGLAIGASLLVRTPLLLFPPAVVFLDWLRSRELSKAFVLRSLALLAGSYVLLVPWGFLNYSVSGRFSLVDDRRAACNLITGAKGSVYTMEGDARKLAGLGPEESALSFYARETLKAPGSAALAVLKRLWHIFLFHPLLFGLFLLAAAAGRGKEKLLALALPAYFILVHAAVSIEGRYFYPLLYILPPLAAGTLWPGGAAGEAAGCSAAGKAARAAFLVFLCAVLAAEAVVAAYPHRSAANGADAEYLAGLPARFPGDRFFQDMKCRLLWADGDDAGYRLCLAAYNKKFGDKAGEYFLAASESSSPADLPLPAGKEPEALVIRMLREFELGDRAAAAASAGPAFAEFEKRHNMLRGEPYRRDRELGLLIKQNSMAGWREHVYGRLLALPPKNLARTLAELNGARALPARVGWDAAGELLPLGRTGELLARRRLASDMPGLPTGAMALLRKDAAGRSKRLADSAVERIRAGDHKAAERLLLEAAELDPANPEALINLCYLRLRAGRKERALEACQGAAYAVRLFPENRRPALELLVAEASFESYELLKSAGRKAEAEKTLRCALENAPPDWLGAAAARAALGSPE